MGILLGPVWALRLGVVGHAGDHMQVQVQQQDQGDHGDLPGIHIAVDNMGDRIIPIAAATGGPTPTLTMTGPERRRHGMGLVFDTGRENPPGTRIWISRVWIPITFLGPAVLPVPLSIKPVPASAGCDYKSCVGDCWSLPICCRGTLGIK